MNARERWRALSEHHGRVRPERLLRGPQRRIVEERHGREALLVHAAVVRQRERRHRHANDRAARLLLDRCADIVNGGVGSRHDERNEQRSFRNRSLDDMAINRSRGDRPNVEILST
jgi:hypothetical protein